MNAKNTINEMVADLTEQLTDAFGIDEQAPSFEPMGRRYPTAVHTGERRTRIVAEGYGRPTVEAVDIELDNGARLVAYQSSMLAGTVEVWADGVKVHTEIYGGALANLFVKRSVAAIVAHPDCYVGVK